MQYQYIVITAVTFVLGVVICMVHDIGSPLFHLGMMVVFGPVLFWGGLALIFGYVLPHQPALLKISTKDYERLDNWVRDNNGKTLIIAYILACLMVAPLKFSEKAEPRPFGQKESPAEATKQQ